MKWKVDTASNKVSRLQNDGRDEFLRQTFTYEVNSINSVNVSVNDPTANEECYENETKKIKPWNSWSVYLKDEIDKRTEDESSKLKIIKQLHQIKQERYNLRKNQHLVLINQETSPQEMLAKRIKTQKKSCPKFETKGFGAWKPDWGIRKSK